jgi:hypothetical protein
MTVTNKPVALIEEATADYVVSFDFLGSLAYEGTSAKLMIQAWYLDENNYVTIYLEWGAQDRPHEVKCIQITGYLNGQHIGWNDGWTDNSKYLPIDGGSFKVEKIGQKFVATYTNDSGYKKVHERTINIDTTKAYSVLAQAEGDTFKLDNYSFKEVKPTNNVTYKSEDQKSSLTIDKNSNNCILNVNGEEQAGFYTLDGSYGIVTIGETQRHFKLVVDKSLLILYTPAQAEEDPKAVTVTPEASVELAKEVEGDIELVMDVKGLIKSNVTADRTNFNLYPWYLDENNYVIAKVEWWGGDRPYEVRSIILEAYINGAKVAGTERFGDWPSTYTLPADGFKLTVTKTGNKFVFKFVSALTGVEKVTDTVTVNGLDTAASYSVVAASVTDTFTVSNVAGLPEVAPELTPVTYTHTFTSGTYTALGTKTLSGLAWNHQGTFAAGSGYWGFDSQYGKGFQFGSAKKSFSKLTLTSTALTNVTSIVVNTSGASSINCKLTVTVGGVQIGSTVSLTSSAKDYTFTSETPLTGEVVLSYTNSSAKAIYVKTITINYAE